MKYIKFVCPKCGNEVDVLVPVCISPKHHGHFVEMKPVGLSKKIGVLKERKARGPNKKQLREIMKQEKEIALRIANQ